MSKRSKKAAVAPTPDLFPMTFETFRRFDSYDRRQFEDGQPSCFNGMVSVERYRITIERVEEPVEVIRERILKLWRESDNYHHHDPLRAAAAKYGLDLTGIDRGCDRRRP